MQLLIHIILKLINFYIKVLKGLFRKIQIKQYTRTLMSLFQTDKAYYTSKWMYYALTRTLNQWWRMEGDYPFAVGNHYWYDISIVPVKNESPKYCNTLLNFKNEIVEITHLFVLQKYQGDKGDFILKVIHYKVTSKLFVSFYCYTWNFILGYVEPKS
jgi:hypothetical protein